MITFNDFRFENSSLRDKIRKIFINPIEVANLLEKVNLYEDPAMSFLDNFIKTILEKTKADENHLIVDVLQDIFMRIYERENKKEKSSEPTEIVSTVTFEGQIVKIENDIILADYDGSVSESEIENAVDWVSKIEFYLPDAFSFEHEIYFDDMDAAEKALDYIDRGIRTRGHIARDTSALVWDQDFYESSIDPNYFKDDAIRFIERSLEAVEKYLKGELY